MKIVRLWLLALIIGISAAAQTNPREHVSMFNMISFTYKHDQHWSAYLESQARSIEDFSKIDYYAPTSRPSCSAPTTRAPGR